MTTITVSSPEQQKGGISLGRQGEYGVREVVFSLSDYISEYGEGTAVLVHKLCDCADPYLVPVEDQGTFDYAERVDDTLIWHIGQMATYKKGYGQIELFWYVDGALKKSVIFGTSVAKSLEYDETRSLNIQKTYLDSISKVLAKSIENAAGILRELNEADRLYNLAVDAAESIATLTVSSETVAPDVPAGVERQVSPENQVNLHFLIPRGEKGETGSSAPFVLKFIPPHYTTLRDPNDPWDPGTLVEVPMSVDKTFAEFEEAYQAGAPIYAYDEYPLTLAEYSAGEYVQFTKRIVLVSDDTVTFITDEIQLNSDDTISSQSFPQTFSKDQVFTIQFSKNGNSYQSNKTYSEVVDAYAAGKILIAEYDGTSFYLRAHSENDVYEFASVGILPTERSVFSDTCFVIYPDNDVAYIRQELTIAPPLIGSSVNTTPTDVINALAAGSPVSLTFADPVYGNIVFTDFSHIANRGMVTSELFFVQNGQYNLIQLYGTTANSRWATNRTILTDLEALNRKLDAPSSSGTSGQILGLDEHLKPVWINPTTDDDVYIVTYRPGGAYPDTTAIIEAYNADKAIFAHIIDGDGGWHILPLTTIEWKNNALESMVFSGGGWSFERKKIMPSAAVTWILTPPLPSIDDVVNYIFRATYNSQTDSYTVTSAPLLNELWETAHSNSQAIVATLYLDGGEEVFAGSDIQFNEVENDSPGSCCVSLAPGDIGYYQLFGTSSGWTMRLVLFTDVTALAAPATQGTAGQVLGLNSNLSPVWIDPSGSSIELDTTLSQSGKAADAAAVGTALAGKGTYSKPSGGIPASDLAAGVIPTVPQPSDDYPLMDGRASPGSSADYARADHAHPSDSSKIGKDDGAVMVMMTASGSMVTCNKGFLWIYVLFSSQEKTYFALVKSQTDYQMFNIDRADAGNQTIYLSSIVGGVLSQIVLTPGGSSTMTGTLTTIDLNLQNAGKTPRIAMTGADTAPTLDPNKLYVFPEMASLSPTFTAPSDNTTVNEYHFIFESGATATTTTFPAIPGLDDFAAEANMAYEVSILEGRALVISWEVSA